MTLDSEITKIEQSNEDNSKNLKKIVLNTICGGILGFVVYELGNKANISSSNISLNYADILHFLGNVSLGAAAGFYKAKVEIKNYLDIQSREDALRQEMDTNRLFDKLAYELELKKFEEKTQAQKHFTEIFNNSPIPQYKTSIDGTVIEANQAFAEFFGYELKHDIIGKSVLGLYANPEQRQEVLKRLSEDKSTNIDIEFKRADGNLVVGNLEIQAMYDQEGKLEYMTGAIYQKKDRHKSKIKEVIVPTCMYCKDVRTEENIWKDTRSGLSSYRVLFSDGICPPCAKKHYPDIFKNETVNLER